LWGGDNANIATAQRGRYNAPLPQFLKVHAMAGPEFVYVMKVFT
jgi:hypothetical protein